MRREIMRLVINALVIIGVWEATGPGMILERPAAALKAAVGPVAVKPLFDCTVCMASVWGLAYWFLGRRCRPLWHVLALAGLMKLVMRLAFPLKSDKETH
ncbi:MAG TPA: hypothetical protein VMQ76_12610 [Terracidiphilus sp.]|nr:hypothetical protein [Terracidiphilus sp.]